MYRFPNRPIKCSCACALSWMCETQFLAKVQENFKTISTFFFPKKNQRKKNKMATIFLLRQGFRQAVNASIVLRTNHFLEYFCTFERVFVPYVNWESLGARRARWTARIKKDHNLSFGGSKNPGSLIFWLINFSEYPYFLKARFSSVDFLN